MTSVLHNRSFRNIWLASLLSMMGSQISRIGLILYLFTTRDSVFDLALLIVLETLPGMFAAPVAGAVSDRASKRAVMVISDLVRAGSTGLILLWPTLEMIYLMTALHSIATAFFQPAKSASIPLIVEKSDLPQANGIDQSAMNLMLIAGPVIGAQLLLNVGLSTTLIIDSLSFLVSAWLVARVKTLRVEGHIAERSTALNLVQIKVGWQYFIRHRLARHLNLLFFVSLLCTGIWMPLAPFFIRQHLGASEHILGWQLGVFGTGTVVGALLAPRLIARFGKGLSLFVSLLAEASSLIVYALVSHVGVSMVVIFTLGIIVSFIVVPFYSILQVVVAKRFLGRVFSVIKLCENLAIVLAMVAAMLLNDLLGSRLIFLIAGSCYFGLTMVSSLTQGGKRLLATP